MNAGNREAGGGKREADRHVLIVGLGASGTSALRHLAKQGARITVTDSRAAPAGIETLRAAHPEVDFLLGGFSAPEPLSQFAEAVVSPGVSLDEPLVKELLAGGIPVIGDIELFARELASTSGASRLPPPVIGITGSNGKSTVTTLVGEMARAAGLRVKVGGNLGTPALDLIEDGTQLYVLELSSFQLETTHTLACTAAAFLNLSEDHLDRHGTMKAYGAAKARIFRNCLTAVVNRDDAAVMDLLPACSIETFGLDEPRGRAYGLVGTGAGTGADRWLAQGTHRLLPLAELRIQGLHNAANALAALALANAAGIPRAASLSALAAFTGLPHRCEFVAARDGVTWLNDSKGTNVGSTLAALQGLGAPIVWLGGGQGKGQDFSPLAPALARTCRAAVLFGEDAGQIEQAILGALPVYREPDLASALRRAKAIARPADRVLLSPACASFDQFRNYVERGERFSAWVREHA